MHVKILSRLSAILLIASLAGVSGLLMFPPWKFVLNLDTSDIKLNFEYPGPQAFILSPPQVPVNGKTDDGRDTFNGKTVSFYSVQVDVTRLSIMVLTVTALFGVPYYAIRVKLRS